MLPCSAAVLPEQALGAVEAALLLPRQPFLSKACSSLAIYCL